MNEKYQKNSKINAKSSKSMHPVANVDESSALPRMTKISKSKKSVHRLQTPQQLDSVSTISRLRHRFKSTDSFSHYYKNHLSNNVLVEKHRSKSTQPLRTDLDMPNRKIRIGKSTTGISRKY